MIFTGDTALLGQKGYDTDSTYEYFCKTIKNNKTNTKTTCCVNIYTKRVSFVGDERNKAFFLNELKGYLKEDQNEC